MIVGRRAFLVGASLLGACRGCPSSKPAVPITAPPFKLIYTAKGRIEAFSAGADTHHFVESILVDGGYRTRVIALARASGTTTTLTEVADSYPTLAVSSGFVWFRSAGKLARVPRGGGAVETFFPLPHDLYPIAADAAGAYAFRPLDETTRLSTNVDLVHVDEKGALTVLARELFPDVARRLATTKDDVLFWNRTGAVSGPAAVVKSGGPLRVSGRKDDDLVQGNDVYRAGDDGVSAIDPTTGAPTKKLMVATQDDVLGVLPSGIVLVHTEAKTASFGANTQSFSYALDFYDFAAENRGAIFDLRPGGYLGGGASGAVLAWATDGEIGEVG